MLLSMGDIFLADCAFIRKEKQVATEFFSTCLKNIYTPSHNGAKYLKS
jgi:hypothetical protein